MFTAILFIIKSWKQPRGPVTGEQSMVHPDNYLLLSIRKRRKKPQHILLRERRESETAKCF